MIEITTFRAAVGVANEELLAADDELRTQFLYQQPGLMRATTARADDGEWIVIVLWGSADDADGAWTRAETDAVHAKWRALVDEATVRRTRYATFD